MKMKISYLRKGVVYSQKEVYITTSPVLGPTALYVGPSLNGAAFRVILNLGTIATGSTINQVLLA